MIATRHGYSWTGNDGFKINVSIGFLNSKPPQFFRSLSLFSASGVLLESPYPDEKPYDGDLVRRHGHEGSSLTGNILNARIHYVGRLSDGTCFDNSRTRGQPFEFILGESEVSLVVSEFIV